MGLRTCQTRSPSFLFSVLRKRVHLCLAPLVDCHQIPGGQSTEKAFCGMWSPVPLREGDPCWDGQAAALGATPAREGVESSVTPAGRSCLTAVTSRWPAGRHALPRGSD